MSTNVPVYLAAAAAVSSVLSIVGAEVFMAAALIALIIARKWNGPMPAAAWPIAGWMAWTFVSLFANGHIHEGLPQIKKLIWFPMLFLVYYALAETRQIRATVFGFAAAATASSLWGFGQFARKYRAAHALHRDFYGYYVADRITGFMGHWMTLSGHLMMALLLAGALVLLSRESKGKLWLIPAGAIIAAALVLALTRSMWGGAVVGAVYLIWVSGRRWLLLSIPILAAVLYVANPFSVRERMISIVRPHGDVDSNDFRVLMRQVGSGMIAAHPLIGVGPEQVGKQYPKYLPQVVPYRLPSGYYGHLHNIYYHYAAERGLPALVFLLWFLLGSIWDFAQALRRAPEDSESRWILHGAIAVILAVMAGGYYEVNLGDSEVLGMFLAVVGCGYSAARATPK